MQRCRHVWHGWHNYASNINPTELIPMHGCLSSWKCSFRTSTPSILTQFQITLETAVRVRCAYIEQNGCGLVILTPAQESTGYEVRSAYMHNGNPGNLCLFYEENVMLRIQT